MGIFDIFGDLNTRLGNSIGRIQTGIGDQISGVFAPIMTSIEEGFGRKLFEWLGGLFSSTGIASWFNSGHKPLFEEMTRNITGAASGIRAAVERLGLPNNPVRNPDGTLRPNDNPNGVPKTTESIQKLLTEHANSLYGLSHWGLNTDVTEVAASLDALRNKAIALLTDAQINTNDLIPPADARANAVAVVNRLIGTVPTESTEALIARDVRLGRLAGYAGMVLGTIIAAKNAENNTAATVPALTIASVATASTQLQPGELPSPVTPAHVVPLAAPAIP